jgi:hypothetical protein
MDKASIEALLKAKRLAEYREADAAKKAAKIARQIEVSYRQYVPPQIADWPELF